MIEQTQNPVAGFANPEQLHRDGYVLLRGAVPMSCLDALFTTFAEGVTPDDQCAVPLGAG